MLLVGVIYSFRLFYMQVIDDTWKLRAQEIAEKRKEIIPARGVVFDRNGQKIVSNKTYFDLMMVEDKIKDLDTVAFAKLIGWTVEEVRSRFKEIREGEGTYYNKHSGKRTSNYQKVRAYPFIKELTLEEISKIAPHLEKFPGFYEEVTSMRSYPFRGGANILGYLAEVNGDEIEKDEFYRPGSNIGRAGLEKYYENDLRGYKGVKYVVTSALNNAIESYAGGKYDTTAVQAAPLTLGLDMLIQTYGEELMKNKKGCIVAIEPSSGEILAMVSSPSYDPNLLSGRKNIRKNYPSLVGDPGLPLFARPLQAEYPPGSIFKLLQSLICLQEGKINPNTAFSCNKKVVGCHNHPTATSVAKAIQYSCNPYFYAAVRKVIQPNISKNKEKDAVLGLEKWYQYMLAFGLGKKLPVDIDFSAQRGGLIPNAQYYNRYLGKGNWSFSTICSIAIGQGEIKLTPLQMANIAAMIANRGWFITPHFVKSIGNKGPKPEYLTKKVVPVERKHFDAVIEGMRRVVYEPGGTGAEAKRLEFTVCGKTGTVQNGKNKKNHAVFVAFAPKDNPKIALAVFVENAGAGGEWAAPIAGLILD
ncbi:MAG TPA: peptidoglycan glycosyltransferase, partial [Crocinitomicaceae bacterium]|nr:peptidoglycan glycosyltransferase [Crocinitomicaceae bacterium]